MRCVVLASSFLALAAALPAAAGPVAPTKPSQIVTAIGRSTSPACPGVEPTIGARLVNQLAGNDGSPGTFAIPANSVFVVTSLEFQLSLTNANVFEGINLLVVDPAVPPGKESNGNAAFAGGVTDANGVVVGSLTFPSGFVVEPPGALCFQARAGTSPLIAVHGFFAKNK